MRRFNSPYDSDELEYIGEVEWTGESYQFDITAVWYHPESGLFYWGDDSGCSCPTPFEDVHDLSGLEAGNRFDVIHHLEARGDEGFYSEHAGMEMVNLIDRIVNY